MDIKTGSIYDGPVSARYTFLAFNFSYRFRVDLLLSGVNHFNTVMDYISSFLFNGANIGETQNNLRFLLLEQSYSIHGKLTNDGYLL